ncbi:MAG: hypothetical protein AAF787_20225 [Chloroflexota bacterium]
MIEFKASADGKEYGELIALWNAVYIAKFLDDDPIKPEVQTSSFIADILNRLADTLNECEQLRIAEATGKKRQIMERNRGDWHFEAPQTGTIWDNMVGIGARKPEYWQQCDSAEKREFAEIILAPFRYDDDVLSQLITAIDKKVAERN